MSPAISTLLERPRAKAVTANGLRFAYTEWGDPAAPLVLCLHGFPVSQATWKHLGPALARAGYRVVAPAMRGYHPTEAPADGDYGARTLGRDVLAIMDALGAETAAVVGHDWGAVAALAATTLAPDRVSKLVVVAIPHPGATTPDALLKADHFLSYPWPGAATRFASGDAAGVDGIFRKWSPTWRPTDAERDEAKLAFRRPDGATAAFGYYRSLISGTLGPLVGAPGALKPGTFATPTMMIYGEADGAVDGKHFEASRRFFTGPFRVVGLDGVGHFPQQERPEAFNRLVSAFLGRSPMPTTP
jgi:pimeloyl-ACP methyl ester carboxylesterase